MVVRGRGGGQVVSVLTFYSDDPSLNSAEAYSYDKTIWLVAAVWPETANKNSTIF